ncbi:Amidohydrolase family protein [Maridesulfovibrio ferrireducens]|uniref:Amidohydrolase family protein n=1 Tax=Maridesulfovibrio ferrireducens TaxID=246191 RepID=A0A1G9IYM7_9BACT|nr:amidohydrolase family protein [Maridesulfovibrio ferrireducens]SDL30320.1 Amidohydrolase family protein [Maridesulfovibrio ferrireducens]
MNCPKRSETALLQTLTRSYPELLGVEKRDLRLEDIDPDVNYRIEPECEYDPDAKADLVIKNACLNDGRKANIAIAGNIITRVGSADEIDQVIGSTTKILDAKGNSVSPGFVDSHLHLDVAMQRLGTLTIEDVETAADFKKRLRKYAKENSSSPILYVFGLHYFDDPIIPAETCRQTLDEIVNDKPLLVFAHDMHTAWANTRAVEEAELLHKMPPYPPLIKELGLEQKIIVDSNGIPTGEFREPDVYSFLEGPLQAKYPSSVEQQLSDLEVVCKQLAGYGITGVHRMALAQPAEDLSFLLLLLELEQQDRLPIRVSSSFSSVADHNMLNDVLIGYAARDLLTKARKKEITAAQLHDRLLELLKDAGTDRHEKVKKMAAKGGHGANHPMMNELVKVSRKLTDIIHKKHIGQHAKRENPHQKNSMPEHIKYHAKIRLDTLKIFMDGVIEKDTAYRLDKDPSQGIPEFNQDDLDRILAFADRLGIQVAAHSIGDGSVKSMLDAISKARKINKDIDKKRGDRIPHRVEHIETCSQEDLPRFGKLDVIASMQPLHERGPMTMWHTLVPKSEWNTAFAWKETLVDDATLVFGSDWPIVSCDPRAGINHAVTRKPWYEGARNQSVSLNEAVAAYTSGAALSEYCQNIKGEIKSGMLADMVILSGNIKKLEKESFNLEIETTICDGKVVYMKQS